MTQSYLAVSATSTSESSTDKETACTQVGGAAMALTAQPLGNTGGYTYLYVVRETSNKDWMDRH